ncbi:hypothetical protein HDU96_000420 [Phlyctochytrium bullatum]|nr:hypothetical protein HDU96_000420 [Phlyctochytrium bullatum]
MPDTVEPNDLLTVLVSVGVQTAIAFGLIIAFSILRPTNKIVYQPRLKFAPEGKKPKPLGPEPTAWIGPIMTVNESTAIGLLGLDAVIFLRYLKFLMRMFLVLCLFGIPMIGIYYFYPRIVGQYANMGVVSDPNALAAFQEANSYIKETSTTFLRSTVIRTSYLTVSGTLVPTTFAAETTIAQVQTISRPRTTTTTSTTVSGTGPTSTLGIATSTSGAAASGATGTTVAGSVPASTTAAPDGTAATQTSQQATTTEAADGGLSLNTVGSSSAAAAGSVDASTTGASAGSATSAAAAATTGTGTVVRVAQGGPFNFGSMLHSNNFLGEVDMAKRDLTDEELQGLTPLKTSWGLKHHVKVSPREVLTRRDLDLSSVGIPNPSLSNLTMTMIDVDHPLYWLPAGVTWLISLIVYFSILRVWLDYIKFRKEYFSTEEFQKEYHNRLLLVTNVPDSLQNNEALLKYFSSLGLKYPPRAAIVNRNPGDLTKLVAEHEKLTKKLEKILAKYLDKPDQLPPTRPTTKDANGANVDAISHLSQQINELEERIYKTRARQDTEFRTTASAFVAFDSVKAAHSAARKVWENPTLLLQHNVISPPKVKLAPAVSEVLWDNVSLSAPERWPRRLIALGLTLGLTIAWLFFVTVVSTLEDLRTLFKSNAKVLEFLDRNRQFTVVLQGFLAPVILAVAFALLPIVLRFITRFQGVSSTHGLEKSVLYKLFFFQVYQVFVTIAFKTLLGVFQADKTQQQNVTDLYRKTLTDALVQIGSRSTYYITLFATYFAGYGIEIIQLVPFIMNFIKRKFFKSSPRELYLLNQPPEFNFAVIYGSVALAFTVALTFSVIAPIILVFAVVFFCLAYTVMKYQFMYVYEVRRETGGTWWPKVFNLLTIGLTFFQVITLATVFTANIGSNSRQRQWVLLMPLPFLTAALWFGVVRFLAPKAMYVSKKDLPYDDSPTQALALSKDDGHEHSVLEDRALNPAFVKPLLKVWVWKRSQHLLAQLHKPRYESLEDYIRQHPESVTAGKAARNKFRLRMKMFHSETLKRDRQQIKARQAVLAGDKSVEEDDVAAGGLGRRPTVATKASEHLFEGAIEDELPPEELALETVSEVSSAVSSAPGSQRPSVDQSYALRARPSVDHQQGYAPRGRPSVDRGHPNAPPMDPSGVHYQAHYGASPYTQPSGVTHSASMPNPPGGYMPVGAGGGGMSPYASPQQIRRDQSMPAGYYGQPQQGGQQPQQGQPGQQQYRYQGGSYEMGNIRR